MTKETSLPAKQRIWELDALRGLCILCMVAIHAFWDLSAFGGFAFDLPAGFCSAGSTATFCSSCSPVCALRWPRAAFSAACMCSARLS